MKNLGSKAMMIMLAVFAAGMISSCENTIDNEEPQNGNTITFTCEINSLSKVDVSNEGKTTWEVGDQILINAGSNGNTRETVTLKASDISADGRSAKIAVTIPPYEHKHYQTGERDDVSTYYAMYPADAVAPKALYYNQAFTNTNAMLMAGCNKDNTIVFYNVCGLISFTVSGEIDSYIFCGNNGDTVGYDVYQCRVRDTGDGPTLTSPKAADSYQTFNPLTTVKGSVVSDGTTLNYIYIPVAKDARQEFTQGFTLKLLKDGKLVKIVRTQNPMTIARNRLVRLGSLDSHMEDPSAGETHKSEIPTEGAKDLCAEGTANCYIVSGPGTYKFKAVKGNSNTSVDSMESVDVVWETWCDGEAVTAGSVVKAVDFEDGWVYFQVAEGNHPGNALIAARNSGDSVIWSWHIWVPETTIESDTYKMSAHLVMDRNLGALVTAKAGAGSGTSFGLFYQWGRKDPIPGMQSTTIKTAATVSGKAATVERKAVSIAEATANPTVIYALDNVDWNSTADNDLWGKSTGNKTMYDPCPPGYKVPRRSDAGGLFTSLPDATGWEEHQDSGYLLAGDPAVSIAYSGYIDDYITSPGSYAYPGDRIMIWSADGSDAKAYGLDRRFDASPQTCGAKSNPKARGGSVRCVSEAAAPFVNEPGMPVMGSYTKTDFSSTQMAELSGLCFSKDGDFMWGVGDGGTLYKIGFDMSVTVQMTPTQTSEADLEGVTMDPVTKDLYFCCEPDRIRKTTAPNYNTITKIIEVTEAAEMGNSGLEGITYYKDNVIYTGSQYGANLWAYNLNGTKLWKKALGSIAFEIQEVGDLYYDPETDLLWVSDSEAFKIFVFDGAVTTLKAMYNISFIGNPEAILVDHARSCVWVGDDRGSSSRIYKISFTDL